MSVFRSAHSLGQGVVVVVVVELEVPGAGCIFTWAGGVWTLVQEKHPVDAMQQPRVRATTWARWM